MTPETVIDILREALWMIVLLASLIIGPGLVIGLVVSTFQAATQINEQTLSFVPKMAIVIVTMALMSGFMLSTMTDYFTHIFDTIATMH